MPRDEKEMMPPAVTVVQFQALEATGLLIALCSDGSIWFTRFGVGLDNPPPVWTKFWSNP